MEAAVPGVEHGQAMAGRAGERNTCPRTSGRSLARHGKCAVAAVYVGVSQVDIRAGPLQGRADRKGGLVTHVTGQDGRRLDQGTVGRFNRRKHFQLHQLTSETVWIHPCKRMQYDIFQSYPAAIRLVAPIPPSPAPFNQYGYVSPATVSAAALIGSPLFRHQILSPFARVQ